MCNSIHDFLFFSHLDVQFSALNFPKDSREGFARVNISFPALPSVSVCVRVQWDTEWNEVSTIFSYAAPVFTNEFQLRGQVDMRERILLALIIHGKHLPYKASFPNDGAWHHVCVTWGSSSGHWAIYVDGDKKDTGSSTDTSRDIHGDGIFILGQDQDSFGGNFTEPFFGAITDLNIWSTSLEMRHVTALNACFPVTQEALFSWSLDQLSRHPVVKEVQAQQFCPGKKKKLLFIKCHSRIPAFKSTFYNWLFPERFYQRSLKRCDLWAHWRCYGQGADSRLAKVIWKAKHIICSTYLF